MQFLRQKGLLPARKAVLRLRGRANRESRKKRSETRSGTRIPSECLAELDSLSQQIKDTGSIHHVFVANGWAGEICCERTLRRLVYSGALSVKPHELRRYVRFKRELPKSQKAKRIIIRDVRALIGRTYGDFLAYTAAHKRAMITQYDSVVGQKGDRRRDVEAHSRRIPRRVRGLPLRQRDRIRDVLRNRRLREIRRRSQMPRLLRETLSLQRQSRMREEPRIRALRVPQGEIARRADPGKRGLRV